MNIHLDGAGYAQIDSSLNPANMTDIQVRMNNILNSMKQLDNAQIVNTMSALVNQYQNTTVNFTEFLDNWEEILTRLVL